MYSSYCNFDRLKIIVWLKFSQFCSQNDKFDLIPTVYKERTANRDVWNLTSEKTEILYFLKLLISYFISVYFDYKIGLMLFFKHIQVKITTRGQLFI